MLYINDFLNSEGLQESARFHMPGHKGQLDKFDITEIDGSDNLLMPSGIIAKSQEMCAKVYFANDTFFSTCGSTACVLAMLLYVKSSKILLSRDCHKSAISGCALAGHEAEFAFISSNEITAQSVENALNLHKDATAILLTYPTYKGLCCNLNEIYAKCQEKGVLLLVDSAHGAHFVFSNLLPESASGNADIWCISAHKTLNALNGAALLHCNKSINSARLKAMLNLVHTTSPSYPVLASLEKAVLAPPDWTSHVKLILKLTDDINNMGFYAYSHDPTRLVINTTSRCSGLVAKAKLQQKNIIIEACDMQDIVLITTPFDKLIWHQKLLDALGNLAYDKDCCMIKSQALPAPKRVMSIRAATLNNAEHVPLELCQDRVCAGTIGVYPPGSAVVAPGEIITMECIEYLLQCKNSGADLFGMPPSCVI